MSIPVRQKITLVVLISILKFCIAGTTAVDKNGVAILKFTWNAEHLQESQNVKVFNMAELLKKKGKTQGWEFAHCFSERIAHFFPKMSE